MPSQIQATRSSVVNSESGRSRWPSNDGSTVPRGGILALLTEQFQQVFDVARVDLARRDDRLLSQDQIAL